MIITRLDFLERMQLDGDTLDIWIEEEWLVPLDTKPFASFSELDLARAELIRELVRDLGVNSEGVGVVLHLLDQVYDLRRSLASALKLLRERSEGADAS